jgi:hypothetical protein
VTDKRALSDFWVTVLGDLIKADDWVDLNALLRKSYGKERHSSVVCVVKALTRRGYVDSAVDGKLIRVRVTELGRAYFASIREELELLDLNHDRRKKDQREAG